MNDRPRKLISVTLLLAIVPAYIYLASFEYELGYCNNFDIPMYLIEPSLNTILIFATTLLGVLISSSKLLGLSLPLIQAATSEKKPHLRGINFINGICLFGSVLIIHAYPLSWTLIIVLVSITFFLNFITWGLPYLFMLRKKKSFKEKLDEIHEGFNYKDNSDLITYLMRNFNAEERSFLLVIIIIPLISYALGDGEAMKQNKFQTLASDKNTVVLKKYNDTFVCAKFNRKKKVLSDSLILIKMSDASPLILKTEKIGPLKLK